jgi:hypothetical protein
MVMNAIKVTAHLNSAVAAMPPQLDALLIASVVGHSKTKLRMDSDAPRFGDVEIPLDVFECGWFPFVTPVYRCSSPIFVANNNRHEYRQRYIDVAKHADLVSPRKRIDITATNKGWMKRYYRPIHVRMVDRVVWFAATSDPHWLASLLDRIPSIAGDRARGYGRVSQWSVEECDSDCSVVVQTTRGQILMRNLPASATDFYSDLTGFERKMAAFQPPYYHPRRQTECVVPL